MARLERKLALIGDRLAHITEDFLDLRQDYIDRLESAFERIKNLEVSVFPNLLDDIERAHQIIGGDGPPAERNPLDIRKIYPRKADTEESDKT